MLYYYFPLFLFVSSFFVDKVNKRLIIYIILFYLFAILSLRGDTGADYVNYSERFNKDNSIDLIGDYDSFSLLTSFFSYFNLGNFRFLLFFYAIVTISVLAFILKNFKKCAIFILMYYYSYLFFVQPFNAIRAGASAMFFLTSILLFSNNQKLKSIFFFTTACLLHPTAIAGVLVFNSFLKKRISIILILVISLLVFFVGKLFFSFILDFINNRNLGLLSLKSIAYSDSVNNDVGTRTATFFFAIITLKLFMNIMIRSWCIKSNLISDKYFYILNVHLFSIFLYYFCFALPVVAARFYELIGIVEIIIITYPLIIFKEKSIIKLALFFVIMLQLIVTTLMLGGDIVKPYVTFF